PSMVEIWLSAGGNSTLERQGFHDNFPEFIDKPQESQNTFWKSTKMIRLDGVQILSTQQTRKIAGRLMELFPHAHREPAPLRLICAHRAHPRSTQ
ncbi:MAG: hypothetical protein WBF60_03135, partial [Castellaniella sp.]